MGRDNSECGRIFTNAYLIQNMYLSDFENFHGKRRHDEYTAESKTNRSLGSVWNQMSTFLESMGPKELLPCPRLV